MASIYWLKKSFVARATPLPLLYLSAASLGLSQTVLDPALRFHHSDIAVLESDEFRNDLLYKVTPEKPALRFDLRFHADYIDQERI
jgi:hypothetical protein